MSCSEQPQDTIIHLLVCKFTSRQVYPKLVSEKMTNSETNTRSRGLNLPETPPPARLMHHRQNAHSLVNVYPVYAVILPSLSGDDCLPEGSAMVCVFEFEESRYVIDTIFQRSGWNTEQWRSQTRAQGVSVRKTFEHRTFVV